MPRFTVQDVHAIENPGASPGTLRSKIGEMIVNSTVCRATVQAINPQTGEYRLVLQGTLDKELTKFENQ